MPIPKPRKGLAIRYAYLWRHEHDRGQVEGSKDRPAVVIVAIEDSRHDGPTVTVMPITHGQPGPEVFAVEIPAPTRARLGLSKNRQWVIVQETNTFGWPGPDLRQTAAGTCEYGDLPRALTSAIIDAYAKAHAAGYDLPVFRPPD